MFIHQLTNDSSPSAHYEHNFRIWLESFNPYLKAESSIRNITPAMAAKYEGDFYGLLSELGVSKEYHYIAMMINGYRHANDYDGYLLEIKIPNLGYISIVKKLYNTTKNSLT